MGDSLTNPDALIDLNQSLRQFDGGRATVWDLIRYQSVVVLALSKPQSQTADAYLDCIACTNVSFTHTWEPANIFVESDDSAAGTLRIFDDQKLSVECKTARLTITASDGSQHRLYTSLAEIQSIVDLLRYAAELESNSFVAMTSFFDGYATALSDHLLPWKSQQPSFASFQAWLKQKLGWGNTSADWKHAINATYSDDADALIQFQRLLNEFHVEYDAGNVIDPPPRR